MLGATAATTVPTPQGGPPQPPQLAPVAQHLLGVTGSPRSPTGPHTGLYAQSCFPPPFREERTGARRRGDVAKVAQLWRGEGGFKPGPWTPEPLHSCLRIRATRLPAPLLGAPVASHSSQGFLGADRREPPARAALGPSRPAVHGLHVAGSGPAPVHPGWALGDSWAPSQQLCVAWALTTP